MFRAAGEDLLIPSAPRQSIQEISMRNLLLGLLVVASLTVPAGEPQAPAEATFISRARQLTFEGRRAGEGYFSPDASRLVFQSEREPGNPFFQIYELDFDSGDVRRVSPGVGKTTCAYHRPGTGDIVFASTHHDPKSREYQQAEIEFRESGKERRYDWDYDPEMELYEERGGELVRLTDSRGYDAEASYSPDGEWIVFTSNRTAFERELSAEERKLYEVDPAFFAELYRMRPDGSGLQRLTEAPGYDGGPFFTADGEWIVWRRFDSEGLIADIWRMRPDGSDKRQLTDFGSMSWAPFPHPSGEYLFFTSNKHGFENFELFIVDLAGEREPVRVTTTDGFDGLPVPSPDGGQLAWTSTRRGGKGQIMLARWNHEAALAALRKAPKREAAK
jgi:Tol biopolymer transport system component